MIIAYKIIGRNWIKNFFFINFVLVLLMFSGNMISDLLRSNVSFYEIILNQIITFPEILFKTIPISCLLSGMILVNKLVKTSELTALYSIGFSPIKITSIILNLSLFSSITILILNGFIQPKLLEIKSKKYDFLEDKFRQLKKQGLISSKISNGKMWYRSGDYFFNYSTFDENSKTLKNTEFFKISNSKLSKFETSNFLKSDHNNLWSSDKTKNIQNLDDKNFNNEDVSLSSNKIELPIKISDLKNLEQDILSLNIMQFKKYINKLHDDGVSNTRYLVIFWQKLSTGFSCIIFSIIGIFGLANSNKRSQSLGFSIGVTFIIVIFFWFFDSFLIELGKNGKINVFVSSFGALFAASIAMMALKIRSLFQ